MSLSSKKYFACLSFYVYYSIMFNIGENLKKLRKEKGLSIRRLAQKVGISHNSLSEYERNLINPTLENAIKLCKFFNVSLEYLIFGEHSKFHYNDIELLELFKEVDDLKDEYRSLIKKYIKKIIRHKKEKDNFIRESE